jgi:hypothetical protein
LTLFNRAEEPERKTWMPWRKDEVSDERLRFTVLLGESKGEAVGGTVPGVRHQSSNGLYVAGSVWGRWGGLGIGGKEPASAAEPVPTFREK